MLYTSASGGSYFALLLIQRRTSESRLVLARWLPNKIQASCFRRLTKQFPVQHPELDITSLTLVENYSPTDTPDADLRNLVVFGDPSRPSARQIPMRTGTSAKIPYHALGELPVGKEFYMSHLLELCSTA